MAVSGTGVAGLVSAAIPEQRTTLVGAATLADVRARKVEV